MKKLVLTLITALFILVSCDSDSNSGVSGAFSKYSHETGVTTITVPGWLISLAARMGDLEKEERELLNSIDKVKVLSVENDDLNARINLHQEFKGKINAENDYEELFTLKEDGQNVTIFGKMDEDIIREMVILVGGDESEMVYLKGRISPKLISNLARKSDSREFLSLKF